VPDAERYFLKFLGQTEPIYKLRLKNPKFLRLVEKPGIKILLPVWLPTAGSQVSLG
jgi:hypothetical protein